MVTQLGQPIKLFRTNDTDLGESYLRTLCRATARRVGGTEQAGQGDLEASGAAPPAHSFGEASTLGDSLLGLL